MISQSRNLAGIGPLSEKAEFPMKRWIGKLILFVELILRATKRDALMLTFTHLYRITEYGNLASQMLVLIVQNFHLLLHLDARPAHPHSELLFQLTNHHTLFLQLDIYKWILLFRRALRERSRGRDSSRSRIFIHLSSSFFREILFVSQYQKEMQMLIQARVDNRIARRKCHSSVTDARGFLVLRIFEYGIVWAILRSELANGTDDAIRVRGWTKVASREEKATSTLPACD